MSRLKAFLFAPLMEKLNLIRLFYHRIKTQCFYKLLFARMGRGSTVFKPLLLAGVEKISIGEKVLIRDGARLEAIEQGTIVLEDGVSIEQFCSLASMGKLFIGRNTTLSFDVMLTNIDHEYRNLDQPILQQPYLVADTCIGENCFIGSGVKIQAGTQLGRQCIVGANSVVRGAFPDYCVIVGAPAKIVKRFDPVAKKWLKTDPNGNFLISHIVEG